MPNGISPQSQDDKNWKLAMEREWLRMSKELASALKIIAELSRRK